MEWERSAALGWLLPEYGRADKSPPVAPVEPQIASQSQGPRQFSKQPPIVLKGNSADRGASQATAGPGQRVLPSKTSQTGTQHKSRQGTTTAASQNANKVFRDSPAKARWREGLQPDGLMQLPAAFGTFRHAFLDAARSSTVGTKQSQVKRQSDVFDEISSKTGSYVKSATYSDRLILIWGEHNQVSAAKDLLRSLLAKCNETKSDKRPGKWTKIHPFSEGDNLSTREQREAKLKELRKAPESLRAFSRELVFIWPDDGLPIQGCLGPQLEKLDFVRAKFNVHLYQDVNINCICVIGDDLEILKHITRMLRIIYREVSAQSGVRIKVYIVEPPPPGAMTSGIAIKRSARIAKASLHGDQLSAVDSEKWRARMDLIRANNNTLLLSSVQKALAAIPFFRGHLRMRVNFGSFVMEEYRRPLNDPISYRFEEFQEMVLHEQAKGRLVPGLKVGQDELLERCFRADFLQLMGAPQGLTSLSETEPKFSANFEFEGKNDALLRLEVEFSRMSGAREFEVRQKRWLTARRGSESSRLPLQVGVTDFTRSDWQFEIKSFEFQDADTISKVLNAFSGTIAFHYHPSVRSIISKPHQKVRFGTDVPVARVVEKAALRFRIKGTPYVLELARFDEYRPIDALPISVQGQSTALPPVGWTTTPLVSWSASLLDPEWDNMLGGQANLGAGHVAKHGGYLSVFFPSTEEIDSDDDGAGFWELMALVQKIAELLGPARTAPTSHASYQELTGLLDIELGTLF